MNKSAMRYEVFAREYVIDLNGTRAAIAAGYSENGADVAGSRLLGNARVRKLVDAQLSRRASKLEIKADKVLEELGRLAFANMSDYLVVSDDGYAYTDLSKLSRDQAAAIQEITTETYSERTGQGDETRIVKKCKFKLADKRGSLELLGKNLKLFTDKSPFIGDDGGPVKVIVEHITARSPSA